MLVAPAYLLIYYGLEGLYIVTGKLALYNYNLCNYCASTNFYNFIPNKFFSILFVGLGIIVTFVMYYKLHYEKVYAKH